MGSNPATSTIKKETLQRLFFAFPPRLLRDRTNFGTKGERAKTVDNCFCEACHENNEPKEIVALLYSLFFVYNYLVMRKTLTFKQWYVII